MHTMIIMLNETTAKPSKKICVKNELGLLCKKIEYAKHVHM